jgi:lipopolysaccharide transport system ATP-binding protein
MGNIAIHVEGLGKQYRIGAIALPQQSFQQVIVSTATAPLRRVKSLIQNQTPTAANETFWALKDVSFDVEHGQVVGIIGANGAGKSTLLKILTRITTPTEGKAKLYGRVGSLLEVGTGFHPELTGRENVFLNGAILGMGHKEVRRKFDEIVAFSGIDEFIDTPVKRYSSGMRVRLAFSVAAHLEPEILLIDEVLAVGDTEFRKKCVTKMDAVSREGRTILFVSHNLTVLQQLCPETMLIDHGRLIARGDSMDIIRQYLSDQVEDAAEKRWQWDESQQAKWAPFLPKRLCIRDNDEQLTNRVRTEQPFYIDVEYELTARVMNLKIGVTLSTAEGQIFCTCWDDSAEYERQPGTYLARCEIPGNLFSHGGFIVGLISGLPRNQKLFRDFEILNLYLDASADISNLGRSILRPKFTWQTTTLDAEPVHLASSGNAAE